MKMTLDFLPHLRETAADILVLEPRQLAERQRGYLDTCRVFVAAHPDKALVTAPFVQDKQLCMAYLSAETEVLQPACFLPQQHKEYRPGDDVRVFDTPFGKAALAVLYDAFQPQYARLAALRGCNILFCGVCGQMAAEDYILAGPWSAAQANNLIAPVAAPDASRLIAPCALSADNSGLVPSNSIDTARLAKSYAAFPVFDSLGSALYARYREALS